MIGKLAIVLLGCVAVAHGNPAAGNPWTWRSAKPLMTPIGPIRSPNKSSRIVGGTEAVPHSWPHQVALFFGGGWFCGGFLISDQWVLTAGHCTDGAASVDVVMGAHDITINEPEQVTMTSTNIITHEDYGSVLIRNDIGLIQLPSPVTFNENIQAVPLPTVNPTPGEMTTPTGWGKTSDAPLGGISDVLMQVDVPIITVAECDAVYGNVGDSQGCIDSTGGMGTCNGDSGGPLNYMGTSVGITSFGASAGCEAGYPDAFTRVTFFLDWIEANTGVTPP